MDTTDVTLDIDGTRYPGRLTVPDTEPDSGILVIPGGGHGPFGDIFDRFAETAAESGHHVARFETWEGRDDLVAKTASDFEVEVEAGVEFLRSRGCSTVAIVAKSFGGRLALEHTPAAVDRMVLWAPAIKVGDHEGVPSITPSELTEIAVSVRILQGDEDDAVTVENARTIADTLPDGELVTLSGEDHSFRSDEQRVVDETIAFLSD